MSFKRLLLCFSLVICQAASAQCPSGKALWDAVINSRSETNKSISELLAEMLQFNRLAEKCHKSSDSGLVSMHQRIAALYFNLDSIQPALYYINKSLDEYNEHPEAQ